MNKEIKILLSFIRDICDREHPDVLVGNSCGSFYAQMVAPIVGIPATGRSKVCKIYRDR